MSEVFGSQKIEQEISIQPAKWGSFKGYDVLNRSWLHQDSLSVVAETSLLRAFTPLPPSLLRKTREDPLLDYRYITQNYPYSPVRNRAPLFYSIVPAGGGVVLSWNPFQAWMRVK